MPLTAVTLIAAVGCGGGAREAQPEVIATLKATASPTPSPAPTAVPVSASPAATAKPSPTLPPSETPTPAPNRNPAFPHEPLQGVNTTYQKDEKGAITGAVTTMVAPAAADPDGDQLTYSWAVTTGTITNVGLTGTWVRDVVDGQEAPGKVTVTASDGRGGTGTLTVDFQ